MSCSNPEALDLTKFLLQSCTKKSEFLGKLFGLVFLWQILHVAHFFEDVFILLGFVNSFQNFPFKLPYIAKYVNFYHYFSFQYMVILALLFIAELAAGIAGYVLRDKVDFFTTVSLLPQPRTIYHAIFNFKRFQIWKQANCFEILVWLWGNFCAIIF